MFRKQPNVHCHTIEDLTFWESIVSTIVFIIIIIVIVEHYTSHDIFAKQVQNKSPHRKSEGVGFEDTHDLAEQRNGVELLR